MADELKQTLIDAAQGPASAANDGQSATQHQLTDLIEAQRFLQSQDAAQFSRRRGLVIQKLRPPGAI